MIKLPHIMKDNKGNAMPQRIIFFDTETVGKKTNKIETEQKLKLGAAVYWRRREPKARDSFEWLDFTTAAEFWVWVFAHCHKGERLFLVAHNVSFDFKVLAGFEAMKKEQYKLKKIFLNGVTNIWDFRADDKTIVILDNMNYFKSSLATLGESLEIPKLKMPRQSASDRAWRKYCRRDVEVMVKAWQTWIKFLTDYDLGCFAKTLPSQAMNAYRHRFMPKPIHIHNFDEITAMEREAYHGGRTEAFFIGKAPKGKYHYVDVNSMYPAVMLDGLYPYKVAGRYVKPARKWVIKNFDLYAWVGRVVVSTDKPVFPSWSGGRLVFATGEFETTLSTRELAYAFNNGLVKELKEVVFYHKGNIFRDYVDFFYQSRLRFREEGNSAFAYMCKLMLNSLYGKFGQRNEVFEEIGYDETAQDGIVIEIDAQTGQRRKYRIINGRVEVSKGLEEGFNSFPAIAAHITADARMKLYGYIEQAGWENVYYCDTDSLFVNDVGFANLSKSIMVGRLGALSVVKETSNLVIRGLKDYVFGSEEVIKGIRKDAVKISDSVYIQTQFEGLRGSISKGRLNAMITRQVQKRLSRKYHKGNVTNTGWVKPFALTLVRGRK